MAIRMKTVVTLKAEADCPTHARADVAVRDLRFTIDEPEVRGGTNLGPSPTETAIAALIGCINVIGNKCAESLGIDIGHLHISAAAQFDRRGVTLAEEIAVPFTEIDVLVEASGPASAAELARVGAETEKFCPLSKLFSAAGTKLRIEWRPAAPAADASG